MHIFITFSNFAPVTLPKGGGGDCLTTKLKVMSYEELRKPLRRLKKAELCAYLEVVMNLLTHQIPSDTSYGHGWNDSRKCLLEISGLAKLYDIDVTMED